MRTIKNTIQKKSKKYVSDDDNSDISSDEYETLSEVESEDEDDEENETGSEEGSEETGSEKSKEFEKAIKKEILRKMFETPKKTKNAKTPVKPQKKSRAEEKVKSDEKSKNTKKNKKNEKKHKDDYDTESTITDDDNEDDSEFEDEVEDDLPVKNSKKKNNLILYIGGGVDEDYDEDYDEDEDDYIEDLLEEHDEEEYKKEEEEVFMKEKYEKLDEPPIEKTEIKKNKKSNGSKKEDIKDEKKLTIEEEYLQLQQTKKMLLQEMKKRPNKIYKNALEECNKDIKELVRRGKKENLKRYHKLIKQERKKQNEYDYFRKELSNQEQNKIIDDLDKITKNSIQKKPYRFIILESSISPNLKSIALQKVNQLNTMCSSDSEYHKIKNWIDTFMKIPFGIYKNIEVNMERDGIEACNQFMVRAQTILDECTYGLKEAKLQIMQMLGNWMTNPSAVGTSIAIKGPPGTGKTSLVKDGISKIMGREFVFIPLGGAGDGSYLEGHSYTYEGSCWGKIVQSLIECKSMNPVFYFDELDKISDSPRGQEIMGILTHLTDTTQNTQFTDKYFAEINEFDLSKCLFIFSYNDESKISPILLNRMHIITTKGYSVEDKLIIGRKYLLPKILKQVNMLETDVVLTDDILRTILTNEQYIQKEDGVRNFKRALEIIYSKINLFRVMKPDNEFFKFYKDIQIDVSFPYTLIKKDLDVLVKNEGGFNSALSSMYV